MKKHSVLEAEILINTIFPEPAELLTVDETEEVFVVEGQEATTHENTSSSNDFIVVPNISPSRQTSFTGTSSRQSLQSTQQATPPPSKKESIQGS